MSNQPYRTISEQWKHFKESVIPNVSRTQELEMRKAYYAGFHSCFQTQSEISATENEDEAIEAMTLLNKEIEAFFAPDGGVWEKP